MTVLTLPTEGLPLSQAAARRAGSQFYFTGRLCPKEHQSPRYTRGGTCVLCTREKNVIKMGGDIVKIRSRGLLSIARSAAVMSGVTTYQGGACPSGHTERFTTTNNCVECDRLTQDRDRERKRWVRREKLYGLTEADYFALRAGQKEACPICTDPLPDIRNTHVDHCHATGRVRGLLCGPCNQGIGLLRESETIMRRAIAYVAS